VWTLQPNQRYFLTVSVRTGIAAPPRPSEAVALRTLPEAELAAVQADADAIHTIEALDPLTRQALLAGLYAEHGLHQAAIAAYEEALTVQPVPLLSVALGDLYLETELLRFAFHAYQAALDALAAPESDDPAVRAAAEFGIGLVYYGRANYAAAVPHFETAIDLYTAIGAATELQAAQHALAEAQERLSS
jgi:tetratricopeptide (TPR) repeat protein